MKIKPWNFRVLIRMMMWMVALMTASFASAQTLTVSGTVSDPTGDLMVGVSVYASSG